MVPAASDEPSLSALWIALCATLRRVSIHVVPRPPLLKGELKGDRYVRQSLRHGLAKLVRATSLKAKALKEALMRNRFLRFAFGFSRNDKC